MIPATRQVNNGASHSSFSACSFHGSYTSLAFRLDEADSDDQSFTELSEAMGSMYFQTKRYSGTETILCEGNERCPRMTPRDSVMTVDGLSDEQSGADAQDGKVKKQIQGPTTLQGFVNARTETFTKNVDFVQKQTRTIANNIGESIVSFFGGNEYN